MSAVAIVFTAYCALVIAVGAVVVYVALRDNRGDRTGIDAED